MLSCLIICFFRPLGICLSSGNTVIFLSISSKWALNLLKKSVQKKTFWSLKPNRTHTCESISWLSPGLYTHHLFRRYLADAWPCTHLDPEVQNCYSRTARVCIKIGNSEEFDSTGQTWFVGAFQIIDTSSS